MEDPRIGKRDSRTGKIFTRSMARACLEQELAEAEAKAKAASEESQESKTESAPLAAPEESQESKTEAPEEESQENKEGEEPEEESQENKGGEALEETLGEAPQRRLETRVRKTTSKTTPESQTCQNGGDY